MVVYYKYSRDGSKKVGKDNGGVTARALAVYFMWQRISCLQFIALCDFSVHIFVNGAFNAKHSIGGVVFTVNECDCH